MRKMEYSFCHECGTKKKFESPTGMGPMTSRRSVWRSNHWATGRLVTSEVIFTEFVVTRVLHTARISNVESTMCDNKERKMGSIPVGDADFFSVPRSWQTEYSIFSFLSELKIYHLSFFISKHGSFDIADPSRTRVATNSVNMTSLVTSLPVAQWLECLTSVW